MVDAMREALNALMGEDRDLPAEVRLKPKPKRRLDDPKLCKHFLCGFCPAEEFQRTKHDYGTCTLAHDEETKAEWDALPDEEKAQYGYELDLRRFIDKMLEDLRRKIQRNETRLKQNEIPVLISSEQANINMLTTKIAELVRTSEKLGEEGDVDGAQTAAAQAETLKQQKATLEAEAAKRAASGQARPGSVQYVCEISGVIVSNEESRIRDHLSGRNYKAWARTHEKYKELKETLRKRDSSGSRSRAAEPSSRSANEERDRDHDRDRRRDKSRDRDHDRDRSRRRHSERDHDRRDDGHRDRRRSSRDRSRERSPSRRSRGRSRER